MGSFNGSKSFGIIFCVVIIFGCNKEQNVTEFGTVNYSFFIAGHTYGTPGGSNVGLYPPFKQKFSLLNAEENLALGVLTGDIVRNSNESEWNAVDADLNTLNVPVHFAVGNHDVTNPTLFETRYGATYYAFNNGSDLFIILDPNIDGWNISGDQLSFLDSTLNANSSSVNNIFIFSHQLLWWQADNIFSSVYPNSLTGRNESTNFWSAVEPLFSELSNDVFLFTGDVGAFPTGKEVFYHCYDNVRFIASGMGGGQRDNFIITEVSESGQVRFRLVALNGDDINGLGELTDHQLP
ncbi:MAG: metallophosphoesterase family protein [Flavobacteriales bacterium]